LLRRNRCGPGIGGDRVPCRRGPAWRLDRRAVHLVDRSGNGRAAVPEVPAMTREEVIARLAALPSEMADAELAALAAEWARLEAAAALEDAEAALLIDPELLTGKNAEQRQAQLRSLTKAERTEVEGRTRRVALMKVSLHRSQAEHASLRAIARLLAAEPD